MKLSIKRVYLHYFDRYPNLLLFEEPSEFDSLTEEFNEYQLLRDSDIPDHVMESCKTDRGDLKLDSLWSFIGQMNDHAENALFSTPLEGCQAYLNYPSFQYRRRTSFFHRKEEQNLLSAKVGSRGDTSQYRHCKTRNGV